MNASTPVSRAATALRRRFRGILQEDHPVAPHTSFNVGGPADLWLEPLDLEDVCTAIRVLRTVECPVTVLGNGTNCLVSDRGIRGAVVSMMKGFRNGIEDCGEEVVAQAGITMPLLAQQVSRMGLTGYEWACGIPGSVGGSVVMNAGAHGGDTAGCLIAAQLVSQDGLDGWAPAAELEYRYRSSRLLHAGIIVTAARFRLHKDNPEAIRERLREYRDKRRAAQPETSQCAGSVFKNPPGGSAGRLLESLGAKGMWIGGAEVSTKHANFIVNNGGARASEVRELIARLIKLAREEAGINLHTEVLMIGDWAENQDRDYAQYKQPACAEQNDPEGAG